MSTLFKRVTTRQLATVLLSAASAAVATAADSSSALSVPPGEISGAYVYSHICQGCHMSHGEGAMGAGRYPKLAGDTGLARWGSVVRTVIAGRNGMPAFGSPTSLAWEGPPGFGPVGLSDAQIADVVNYVRSHFGNSYRDRVTASQVAALRHAAAAAP
jgi:mono/diheme cytochrome c family protein